MSSPLVDKNIILVFNAITEPMFQGFNVLFLRINLTLHDKTKLLFRAAVKSLKLARASC